MSHKQLLSSMICLALIGGLLATCDWPQAAPTPAAPVSSPTSVPPTPPSVLSTGEPSPTAGPEVISRDFSDFTHFSYAQREGSCGFLCPSLGMFEAEISRRPSGDYLLKASIAELGTLGVDQCIDLTSSGCITIIQLPERTLTPAEADAVLGTFRGIEILLSTPWQVECECTCLGSYFQWDSYTILHRDCWDYPRLAGDRVLMSLLDQLTTRSREGLPTATPRPHRCITYDIFPTFIRDIEIAPDHTVWIASDMGAARYDPIQETWTTYTTEQGVPSEKVRTVTVAEDGLVWLAFKEQVGASHYDGERWRTYTADDGLRSNDVNDVAVGQDGTVWFAAGTGVSRWDPLTNTWESYDRGEGMGNYLVQRLQIAGDGSIWLSDHGHATHLSFKSDSGEPSWRDYDKNSTGAFGGDSLSFDNLTLAPDGKIWVQARSGPVFHDPNGRRGRSPCCPWSVSTFALTDSGGLWAGNDGVDFFPQAVHSDATILLHYDVNDGLASNVVHSIAVESDRVVWVGTDKGVSRCEAGQ